MTFEERDPGTDEHPPCPLISTLYLSTVDHSGIQVDTIGQARSECDGTPAGRAVHVRRIVELLRQAADSFETSCAKVEPRVGDAWTDMKTEPPATVTVLRDRLSDKGPAYLVRVLPHGGWSWHDRPEPRVGDDPEDGYTWIRVLAPLAKAGRFARLVVHVIDTPVEPADARPDVGDLWMSDAPEPPRSVTVLRDGTSEGPSGTLFRYLIRVDGGWIWSTNDHDPMLGTDQPWSWESVRVNLADSGTPHLVVHRVESESEGA